MNELLQLLSNPLFRVVLVLPAVAIALDTLSAVLLAIRAGTFSTIKLADYLQTNLLPYVSLVGATLFTVGLNFPVALVAVAGSSAYATFMASQLASIKSNISKLTGLPISVVGTVVNQGATTVAPDYPPVGGAVEPSSAPVGSPTASAPTAPVSPPAA